MALAPVLWAINGLEVSTAVVMAYAIGLGLLLVSAGLWWNRRLTMSRAYAEATQRTVSNNYLRRQRRGRRDNRSKPFLEPLGVNKGLRTYRPELFEGVETCGHPDYVRRGPKRWDCVRCSLTVIADRKPVVGAREIV